MSDRISQWLSDSGNPVIEFADWLLVRDTIADAVKTPWIDREKANEIAEKLITTGYVNVDTIVNNWRAARADDALPPSPLDDDDDNKLDFTCHAEWHGDTAWHCTRMAGHSGQHSYLKSDG